MDNTTRSQRSRAAILQAAQTVITRDGPSRLTMDAIAQESGLSKGGVMHQFKTKRDVVKALLKSHSESFQAFSQQYQAQTPNTNNLPLATEIAVAQEAAITQQSVSLAIMSIFAEEPELLSAIRAESVEKVQSIKQLATDPDLAMLRWAAAKGLMLNAALGLSPFTADEEQRLFARLLDDASWEAHQPK